MNRTFEPNAAPGLDQVLMTNTAEFWIVANEIRQFPALLHQVTVRKTRDSILKT